MKDPQEGPLSGVRILDLTQVLAGPFCTMLLGDFGAEVIKIEPPPNGEHTRKFGPYYQGDESAYFLSVNRNKKSMMLNLQSKQGKKIFFELLPSSDVVIYNFRAGVIDRLGINYETAKEVNPKIIYCSITGFGESGPYKCYPSFDIIVQAMGGGMSLTGAENGPPEQMGFAVGDNLSGLFALQGILAALFARERKSIGQKIEISMLNCQVAMLPPTSGYYLASGKVPGPKGSKHLQNVPVLRLKTSDGYIVIYAALQKFWQLLCEAIEHPEFKDDPRFITLDKRRENRNILEPILEEIFLTKNNEEWLSILREKKIPVGSVNNLKEVFSDEHILSQGMLQILEHPAAGKIKVTGNPIKMSETFMGKYSPPPLFKEHSHEILTNILGYSESKIKQLEKDGIV